MAKLLVHYVDAALAHAEGTAAQMKAAAAADIAIELCLAIDKRSLLWSTVLPQFAAKQCSAALLDRLLPHILSNQLTALAPEVMQVSDP